MDDLTLQRCLSSIGKQAFVHCFWSLRAVAQGEQAPTVCVQTILKQGYGTTISGAQIRVNMAKRIFNAGRAQDAINLVLASGHPAVQGVQNAAQEIRDRLGRGDRSSRAAIGAFRPRGGLPPK